MPINTAAPTAPASAVPPDEKLAAGSSIKISVSSPACSMTEPSASISALPPILASVVDFTTPADTEPAPEKPPDEPAMPTTVAVRFCSVSAVTSTCPAGVRVPSSTALTFFQNTFAPKATPTDVLLEAASVPVKSVMLEVSLAVTKTPVSKTELCDPITSPVTP